MSDVKKILCLSVLFSLVAGCGPYIPISENPVAVEKVFHAPSDKVWDNCLDIIKGLNGTIITRNKSAGLITYTYKSFTGTSKPETYKNIYYTNIYIKKHPQNQNDTIVHIIPFNCSAYTVITFPQRNVQLEFQDISFRNDFFIDIGNVFFDGLKARLKESEL